LPCEWAHLAIGRNDVQAFLGAGEGDVGDAAFGFESFAGGALVGCDLQRPCVRELSLSKPNTITIGHSRPLRGGPRELARLRRENVRLGQERDLLKRAAAFFAAANGTR
jgi:hypothetical protein